MWESIREVLTSQNGISIAILIIFLVILVINILAKLTRVGLLRIHTKHFKFGSKVSERELIRRQVAEAHDFIMSIEGKLTVEKLRYDGYFTKFILERIYDKVIEWIIFNHITTNPLYVKDKQESICNLVYGLNIDDVYKTPEFKQRVCKWTEELIEKLVLTKTLYGENGENYE